MNLRIQTKSGVPIYTQIENQLKQEIIEGRLSPGELLPSIRSLASDLNISVITTKRAYEELEKEGMVYSVPGKGFFVDNPDREYLAEQRVLTVQEQLADMLRQCRKSGLTKEDVLDMVDILWEEEQT